MYLTHPTRLWRAAPLWLALAASACKADRLLTTDGTLVPLTVEQDASLPAITVNGSRFHAETAGAPGNPMLVILHGGPGADYRYLLRCQAFAAQGYFVVFYDQRGSGLSRREPRASYSIQLMLDDLGAVIAHYRTSPAQPVLLLGHSWGAMLATAYINQHPTEINGAILAEPGGFVWQDIADYVGRTHAFSPPSETLNDATWLDQFLTGGEGDQALLDYKFGLLSYTDGAPDSPLGNDAVLPFWRAGATVNQALFDLGQRDRPDWTTQLSRYTTPVLFVYSERNRAYGEAYARHVASAYPSVDLRRIDGAGHDLLTFETGWNNFFPLALAYLGARVP